MSSHTARIAAVSSSAQFDPRAFPKADPRGATPRPGRPALRRDRRTGRFVPASHIAWSDAASAAGALSLRLMALTLYGLVAMLALVAWAVVIAG